jgi:hypothetical protein
MPRYLISFDDGSMDHISEQDWPAVGASAHAVVREAKAAGVWIFGGGLQRQRSSIVATDGTITDGPVPETKAVVGGFSIVEVASREDALRWAARIANACRCAQTPSSAGVARPTAPSANRVKRLYDGIGSRSPRSPRLSHCLIVHAPNALQLPR